VVFASRANNGSAGCHLDKEVRLMWCGKRNSSGTR
jgi:hypothetical protein